MSELMPCPFCGNIPAILISGCVSMIDATQYFNLEIKCCIKKELSIRGNSFKHLISESEYFIAGWNARHENN